MNSFNWLFYAYLLIFMLFSGCNSEPASNNRSTKLAKEFPVNNSEFVLLDSIEEPQTYQAQIISRSPAFVVDQITQEKKASHDIEPRTITGSQAEVRTPGSNSWAAADTLKATPRIRSTEQPEVVMLKDPVSRDSNPYSIVNYSKVQGLLHDDITCFYEDPNGNMWIGTHGGGLMKYDGQFLRHYNRSEKGKIMEVTTIEGDSQGNIWVGTMKGLFMFDGNNTHYYNSDEGGLLYDDITSLEFDNEGTLWIAYWDGGISAFDGTIFHHYGAEQGLSLEKGQMLTLDTEGNPWITHNEDGLFLFRDGSFYVYRIPLLSNDNPVIALHSDRDNNIWISLYDLGVVRFDKNEFTMYTSDEGFPAKLVSRIIQDKRGRFWFGTWGGGLLILDEDKLTSMDMEKGLSSNYINHIYEDRTGIIWLGYYGGFARHFGDVFRHYQVKSGFDQKITSIEKTPDDKLWIAAYEGGVVNYDGEQFTEYSIYPDSPISYMESMITDAKGNLWLSIEDQGIHRFDGEYFYQYDFSFLSSTAFLVGGMQDSKGNLWLLIGEQGMLKFDGKEFTHFTDKNGLPENYVTSIIEDHSGNIWAGTWGSGIFKMNEDSITYFNEQTGFGSDFIYAVQQDSEENFWFGTYGDGLIFFNGQRVINFNTENGLTDNYVFSITQDHQGNMIFGSRFGLNILQHERLLGLGQFNKTTLSQKQELENFLSSEKNLFTSFTYEDGFLGVGSNMRAIFADKDQVWIGANDRLTAFYPQAAFYDSINPEIKISGIELYNEPVDWKQLLSYPDTTLELTSGVKLRKFQFDSIRPWYHIPESLKLHHSNNFVTFKFSGISTSSGRKLLFSYKLKGFDQNWHNPTQQNSATYGNLPPGDYTFKVRAINRMGQWSDVDQFAFTISTPWWTTWWAWMLYLGSAVLVLVFFIKSREKALILKNQILDSKVDLARKTIEIKQNIIANVSHELRTPLTGIIGMTDIIFKTPLNEEQKNYLLTIKQSGQNLKEIINQILDYSKLESGEVCLRNENFTVKQLFNHAEKVFASLKAKSESLSIRTHIDPSVPALMNGDRGRINQMLQNLLHNAIKFTQEGTITLEASAKKIKPGSNVQAEVLLKISVKDTGIGIASESMDKLFVPFSQIEIKDTRAIDSTGLGLAISKKLAEMLGGEIGVESKKGIGSHFWFTCRVKSMKDLQEEIIPNSNSLQYKESNLNVLLVEDKKVNQMVIKLMLESMGHKVTLAAHGEEALKIYKPGQYDAIFMDIQMPVMDGITATQELKTKHSQTPPIIGLSANAFEGDREKYMQQGMDEYITKPVTEDNIKNVLKRVLDSAN